jgi:hypothetical protein
MSNRKIKIEGSLDESTIERLKWLASRDNITLSEAIDRAVENSAYFTSVVEKGGKVITEESPGAFRKVTLK